MKTYLIDEPFNIYQFSTSQWAHPEHRHTYFEIIFILKGKGVHILNGKELNYAKDDIFFLGPDDYHSFRIEHETEFCYIRFADQPAPDSAGARKAIAFGMDNPVTGFRIANRTDQIHLHFLLKVLRSEYESRFKSGFDKIRDGIMNAIMTILNRHTHHHTSLERAHREVDVRELVTYIRNNIVVPAKLTIPHLASRFNYSSTYISHYFKQHTGESLKAFIIRTRLKLVETRLLYSSAPLSEISFEFGYTDESHLCRQFRKYMGCTPAHFRKRA